MQLPRIKKSVKEFLKCEEGNISKKSLLSIAVIAALSTKVMAGYHYTRHAGDVYKICSYDDPADACLPSVNVPIIQCGQAGSNCQINVEHACHLHCSYLAGSNTHGGVGYKADMVLISGGEVIPINDVECGRGHYSYEHNVRTDCGVGKYENIQKHTNELTMIDDPSAGNMKLTAKHTHNMEEKKYLVWARLDGVQLETKENLNCHCNRPG